MWKVIVQRQTTIESDLLGNGKYVEKYDAMSLASMSLEESLSPSGDLLVFDSESSKKSKNNVPPMRGLSQLSEDVSKVFQDAMSLQQRELIRLKGDIRLCCEFILRNSDYFKDLSEEYERLLPQPERTTSTSAEGNLLGLDDSTFSVINDWNQLPIADDDEYDHEAFHNTYLDKRRRIENMRKRLKHRLEESFQQLQVIVDVKTIVFQSLKLIREKYNHMMIIEAHKYGVSQATYRVNMVTKGYFKALLDHRFLDTSEVRSSRFFLIMDHNFII